MSTAEKRLTRYEIPEEITWDLRDLFPTREDWEVALKSIHQSLPKLTVYKGKLADGAKTLFNCLNDMEAFQKHLIPVATYASLRQATDGTDPVNQADSSKVAGMLAKVNAELSFISSEVLELPEGTIETYLNEEKGLEKFTKYLSDF